MTPAQRLARRLGYDLTPRRKAKSPNAQLVAVLQHFRITCVLDVGANVGQYGSMLREWGYPGRIVSFEPQADAHRALERRTAADPAWQVAPPMALGARAGPSRARGLGRVRHELGPAPERAAAPGLAELRRGAQGDGAAAAVSTRSPGRTCARTTACSSRSTPRATTRRSWPAPAGLIERLTGIQLEMALVPLYEGERGFRGQLDDLAALGFEPWLFLPGYFERKLARQLQVDGVFMRANVD